MKNLRSAQFAFIAMAEVMLLAGAVSAQQTDGPQTEAPPAVAPAPRPMPKAASGDTIVVPAGTRLAVVLENGISTGTARAGDSVYFRTSFPITQNNHVVIPVGSYLRGELTEMKRPGRIKGRGEFRMMLNTLILPNGYTVDLRAVPRSADSGGKETTDSEGKITGPGGKGKDVGTIASTTVTGAGIGAIASGARGAGIGAGIGAAAGLAAVLLTRGPEAELRRGSALDIVLERQIDLDADRVQYTHVNGTLPPYAVQ